MSHDKRGHALLDQYATDPRNQPCESGAFVAELDQLCTMVQRPQTESKGLLATEYRTVGEPVGVGAAPNPAYFATLQDARVSLEKMMNYLSIFFLDLDRNDDFYDMVRASPDDCLSQTAWLETWEPAFSQLLARKQAELTPSERRGATALKAHHLVCEIFSSVDLSEWVLGWDKVHRSFAAIVDLAASVLKKTVNQSKSRQKILRAHRVPIFASARASWIPCTLRSMPRSIASSKSPRSACLSSQARVLVEIVICAESGKIFVAP